MPIVEEHEEEPNQQDYESIWKIMLQQMLSEDRKKLTNVNTLQDVVELIRKSNKIIILTGAGVSVSCGIPDFRSRDGVYARLAVDFPDLPDPQAMFDIHYFRKDPRPFFKFAKEIYPGQFRPSPCHRFIRCIEKHGRLLRNYTQNIDTLEQVVGISNVVQCHGSFATATCTKPSCRAKVVADEIKKDIFDQRIPYCQICSKDYKEPTDDEKSNPSLSNGNDKIPSVDPECKDNSKPSETGSISPLNALPDPGSSSNNLSATSATDPSGSSSQDANPSEETPCMPKTLPPEQPGIMKPDIVFFGEGLGDEFHKLVAVDKNEVDLLIMIGSSLKVRPVALIPSSIAPEVPQILINREPLSHLTPDVELLGDCDGIINQICSMLGEDWQEPVHTTTLSESHELLPDESDDEDDETVTASKPKSENENTEQKVQNKQSTSDNSIGENPTDASNSEKEKSDEAKESSSQPNASKDEEEESAEARQKRLMAKFWKPRRSMAYRLKDGTYFYSEPNRYIFPGAEVYKDSKSQDSNDFSDDDSDDSSIGNASDNEENTLNDSNNETIQVPIPPQETNTNIKDSETIECTNDGEGSKIDSTVQETQNHNGDTPINIADDSHQNISHQ